MSSKLGNDAAWEGSVLGFLQRQLFATAPTIPPSVRLDGKTAIVTGSNIGLGFSCARQLLALGLSHLVMAVRTESKGAAAAQILRADFPDARVDVWPLDMASYASVRALAQRCAAELARLDLAVLNAGLVPRRLERDPATGHESAVQVNYLSTALLALLLLPVLGARAPGRDPPGARLVLVGSDMAHWAAAPDPDVGESLLAPRAGDTPTRMYQRSKLLQILFAAELARRVDASRVVVCVANPGLVRGTDIGKQQPVSWAFARFVELLGRTPEVGARFYLDAAVVKGPECHGSYLSDGRIKPYPAVVYTPKGTDMQQRLWRETIDELRPVDVEQLLSKMR